jgi:hypothetical protein
MVTLGTEKHKELMQLVVHSFFLSTQTILISRYISVLLVVVVFHPNIFDIWTRWMLGPRQFLKIVTVPLQSMLSIQVLHKDPLVTVLGDYQWL